MNLVNSIKLTEQSDTTLLRLMLVCLSALLPHVSVFTTIWITCGLILGTTGWLFRPWWPRSHLRFGHLMWIAAFFLVVGGVVSGSRLDHLSRRWQWGPTLLAVLDTAYHNIALLEKEGQVSVFTNGLWLFSQPDRLSAEYEVHLALLQHPDPKTILLLGGIHFALAVMVLAGTGVALEKIGGGFYALDLAGAAAGVLMAALFIIPVYGIMNTLAFLSVLSGISLLTLLRQAWPSLMSLSPSEEFLLACSGDKIG